MRSRSSCSRSRPNRTSRPDCSTKGSRARSCTSAATARAAAGRASSWPTRRSRAGPRSRWPSRASSASTQTSTKSTCGSTRRGATCPAPTRRSTTSRRRTEPLRVQIPADSVFGSGNLDRGLPEMYIADLQKVIAADRANGGTARGPVMYLHQKFSFPVACLVFALIGLGPGAAHAEGRQARGPDARADRDLRLLRPARAGRDPHQGRPLLARLGPLVPEHRPGRARARASVAARACERRGARDPGGLRSLLAVARAPEERRSPERAACRRGHSHSAAAAASAPAAARSVRRVPVPARGRALLPGVPGALLHRHGHRPLRQSRERPGDRQHPRAVPVLLDAAVHVVRHSDGHARRRAGDDWRTDALERAHGDAGVRRQPVSRGAAAPGAGDRVERPAVPAAGTRPRAKPSARPTC